MSSAAFDPPGLVLAGRVVSSPPLRLPASAVCAEINVAYHADALGVENGEHALIPNSHPPFTTTTAASPTTISSTPPKDSSSEDFEQQQKPRILLVELTARLVGTAVTNLHHRQHTTTPLARCDDAVIVSSAAPTPPGSAVTVPASRTAFAPTHLSYQQQRRYLVSAAIPAGVPPSFRGTYAKFAYAIEATAVYVLDGTTERKSVDLVVPVRVSAEAPDVQGLPSASDIVVTPTLWEPSTSVIAEQHGTRALVEQMEERALQATREAAKALQRQREQQQQQQQQQQSSPSEDEDENNPLPPILPPRTYSVRVGDHPLLRVSLARPGGCTSSPLNATKQRSIVTERVARQARVPDCQVVAPGETLAVLLDLARQGHDMSTSALRCLQVDASLETEETTTTKTTQPIRRVWDEWSEVTVDAQSSHIMLSIPSDATPSFSVPGGVTYHWLIRFAFRAQPWNNRAGAIESVHWELPIVLAV